MDEVIKRVEALIRDELFDASTSPPANRSAMYFRTWQTGYDAALNRLLDRIKDQSHDD